MQKVDVVTVGSAIKDVMFYSDEVEVIKNKNNLTKQKLMAVEYGAKLEVGEVFLNFGGGAMNVGVGLRNFGLKVAPLVNVGKDVNGQEIFYFLRKMKMNTSLVQVDKKHATGFSFILTALNDKEHTIFTFKGSTRHLKIPNLKNIKTSWYAVSSLSLNDWDQELNKVLKEVERTWELVDSKRVKLAWNPGGKQLSEYQKMKKFLPKTEVLIVNKDEAIELVLNLYGKKVNKTKINQPRYLLDLLRQTGARNIVITAASKGAYGIDDKGKYYYESSKAKKIVDTVGAGDAFFSGFIAGFHKKKTFEDGLKSGIKNSTAVLREIGAQNGLLKKI